MINIFDPVAFTMPLPVPASGRERGQGKQDPHRSRAVEELEELNKELQALAAVFPNVRPEVFREMLTTLSKESRAQVVTEHLLKNGAKWIKGRWRVPAHETSSQILKEVFELEDLEGKVTERDELPLQKQGNASLDRSTLANGVEPVPLEETFRTDGYKSAVFAMLRQEFKALSRSTISAVLAEQNHSYTLARPILIGLAAKTWKASLTSLFARFQWASRSKTNPQDEHFMLQWTPSASNDRSTAMPRLRPTGNPELEDELQRTVLEPILCRQREKENAIGLEMALLLNEQEAEQAGATYECQVCFADVVFEQIATCTSSSGPHMICFGCIQRAASEALYGQSWDLTIDHVRGQVACIAPAGETCNGCVPHSLAERAILAGKAGDKVWAQLEARLAEESLRTSGEYLVHCPFCSYCEIDSLYLPSTPFWMLNLKFPLRTLILLLLGLQIAVLTTVFCFAPLLLFYLSLSPIIRLSTPSASIAHIRSLFRTSLATHVRLTHLPRRFVCRNPACSRLSCLDCRKPWIDIHSCRESAALSLRTTVEAARTAAFKRTCPSCGVGFVKDSGCNKMVCVCGYAMCYICRQGIGKKAARDDDREAGYRHFCQHFRPSGGRCTECDLCDLYRAEDEDEIVRRAGQRAEREWRERNGFAGDVKLPTDGPPSVWSILQALWTLTLQDVFDWWVSRVLVCKIREPEVESKTTG